VQDVAGLSLDQIQYAIDEIYARYGATFPSSPGMQRQFNQVSWYRPNPRLTFEDVDRLMSNVEAQNVKSLAALRDAIRADLKDR
jgi:hypothetical protein